MDRMSGFGTGARAARALKSVAAMLLVGLLAAGCGSSGTSSKVVAKASNQKTSGKEYFPESKYGVKASPRVVSSSYDTTEKPVMLVPVPKPLGALQTINGQSYALTPPAKKLRRGGGRDQLGKPYRVRGKWYTPADQPGYSRSGKASWYGDAFHGRLTANGEIYDMNHLTAAHPTLPLPSYARVTNTANGHSVIVRINDRGPYAHGRVIDLSKRAAHVLGTKAQGVGVVKVDYLGRAPVDGADDSFLLASFRPNGTANPAEDMQMYAAFTGRRGGTAPAMVAAVAPIQLPMPVVPAYTGAIAPVVPPIFIVPESRPLGYSAAGGASKPDPFATVLGLGTASAPVEVHVGVFSTQTPVEAIWRALKPLGRVEIADDAGRRSVSVTVGSGQVDEALRSLWQAGYADAFVLR
jgi:rare lipoprotein A